MSINPEMHDLGKLIDRDIIKHNFEDYPAKLNRVPRIRLNPTWKGIMEHHCGMRFANYPKSRETYILSLADSLAASTSRHSADYRERTISLSGKPIYNVHTLWNPPLADLNDLSQVIGTDAASEEWIAKIVEFVNGNPSPEEFHKTFDPLMSQRAEDARPGSNITSLLTHSELTARLYGFLYDYLDKIENDWFEGKNKETISDRIQRVREDTKIKIVELRICFPQNPVRVKDLNVFDILAKLKGDILEKYPNNVIFSWFDELLLITSPSEDFLQVREALSKYGFWLEFSERIQNLDQPFPDPNKLRRLIKKVQDAQIAEFERQLTKIPNEKRKLAERNIRKSVFEKSKLAEELNELRNEHEKDLREGVYRRGSFHSGLPATVESAVCELCQLNPATEILEDTESGITERLCDYCASIRTRGSVFSKLEKWEREGTDRVLWVRIRLDLDELISIVEELYTKYLITLGLSIAKIRAEIRFSVLYEFGHDYREFLVRLWRELMNKFGESNCQKILDELLLVRIESLRDIRTLLQLFDDNFAEKFSKFKESASPIGLGVVCSGVKYPFIECWRLLANKGSEINIHLMGKGEIRLRMSQLSPFLAINIKNKSLLSRLSSLEQVSHELAKVTLYDRYEKDPKTYEQLRYAAEEFGFSNVLTYVKILGD